MEQRTLGRTGLRVSALGLGTEHIHQDRETLGVIFGSALEAGVSYFDLLYGRPTVETAFWETVGPFVRAHRQEMTITGHFGPSDMGSAEYWAPHFEDVLRAVGGRVDIVMLTVVDNDKTWTEWARRALELLEPHRRSGAIGFLGVSNHNTEMAIRVVESRLVDVLMHPINLDSHDNSKLPELYAACTAHNVGLVAMKVYHGGPLLWAKAGPAHITPAQCLAYVLDQPIAVAVPGPRTVEEWQATLHYLHATPEERTYLHLLGNLYAYLRGQCTYCDHCQPCPQGIRIGSILWMLDNIPSRGLEGIRQEYGGLEIKASACTRCGECEPRCPWDVEIIATLERAVTEIE